MDADTIQKTVKEYILREFLPGENPEALTAETPLVTGGILDSLATLKLVDYSRKAVRDLPSRHTRWMPSISIR